MDAASERRIIRLWNRLRLLEKEGRSITAVLRQIESALAERERHTGLIMSGRKLSGCAPKFTASAAKFAS
jgi:hypothetical protein